MVTDRLLFLFFRNSSADFRYRLLNCLGINSTVTDTDLVVLSTIFPGPITSVFLSQQLPLPTSLLPELITVTDTETDADLNYFELSGRHEWRHLFYKGTKKCSKKFAATF